MELFKTYEEAVLANGSVKGIHCAMISNDGMDGVFGLEKDLSIITTNTFPCHPADYLQTRREFLASGKQLAKGDKYVNTLGDVRTVTNEGVMNCDHEHDHKRYVIPVADSVESPEEREEFDRLAREHDNEANQAYEMGIDNTAKQVESLASRSEKPNNSEWKNGDALSYWCFVRKDWFDGVYVALDNGMHVVRDLANDEYKGVTSKRMRKPETPAEREERERWEAAYKLYCIHHNAMGRLSMTYEEFLKVKNPEGWLAVADEAGRRKD